MTKRLFLFITILLFSLPFFSQSKKVEFSVSPYLGFSNGTYDEMLYSSMGKHKEVSRLEWKIEKLWLAGTNINIQKGNFGGQFGLEYAIPVKCGTMYDSDYDSFDDLQFCYSINELKSKINLHTHLDFFYIINCNSNCTLNPKLSVYYFYDFFESRNGYGWYGLETATRPLVSWDDPRATFYEKGSLNGVDFYRHSLMTFTGLTWNIKIQKLTISTELLLSPLAYFYTKDSHLSKSKNYNFIEVQYSSLNQFLISCQIDFSLTPKLNLYTKLSDITGTTTKGNLFTNYDSNSLILSQQQSGSAINVMTIIVGIGILM